MICLHLRPSLTPSRPPHPPKPQYFCCNENSLYNTPSVEILDLAGPVQVFTEVRYYVFEVELAFYGLEEDSVSSFRLPFGKVDHFSEASLCEKDYLFEPGINFQYVNSSAFKTQYTFFSWLKQCSDKGISICSVCNGAFALGYSGLLKNTECTTHWRRIETLQQEFPEAKVLTNVLFKKSNNVYTSAGISAGIDLELAILEELKGALFTYKVARSVAKLFIFIEVTDIVGKCYSIVSPLNEKFISSPVLTCSIKIRVSLRFK